LALFLKPVFAEDIRIEKVQCYQEKDDSYAPIVSYRTSEKWSDGIRFEIKCVFRDKEVTFTYPEGEFINVAAGAHEEEMYIHSNYKKRYGPLKSISVSIYKDNKLMDTGDCGLIRRR
jgi:hypothetical protein